VKDAIAVAIEGVIVIAVGGYSSPKKIII